MIRALVIGLFYALAAPAIALVGFPWTFLTGRIDLLYRLATRTAFLGVKLAGIQVRVVGRERLDPQRTYIYMCNHVSALDPPIVVPLIPRRTSVLVKKELFRIPILARAMRLGSLVAVDRANREAAIASMRAASQVVAGGVNMTIFPEGTRSSDGRLLPFKKGPFYLALETGVPVVPMTIVGTQELMPKGSLRIRPGTVAVYFHEPVESSQFSDREQLMAEVRRRVQEPLPPEYC